ncbi:hypothetical protein [Thiogranum longum]|nr:hypothetical protein [Thiogranum longum]
MRRKPQQNILRAEDAANLYLLVLIPWELGLKKKTKGFDFEASAFKAFRETSNLDCTAFESSNELKKQMKHGLRSGVLPSNMILFLKGKNKAQGLIRAVRNAAAHGGVKESKIGSRWYICFDGNYRGKQNLYGRIQRTIFEEFLHALMSTAEHA